MKKIAIITEFLVNYGGIEKEVLTIAKGLNAEIYAGIYNPETTYPEFKKLNVKSFMRKKLPAGLNSLYLRWKFSKLRLGNRKAIIFGFNNLGVGKHNRPNLWRSTQPLSYLYGFSGDFDANLEQMKKITKNPLLKAVKSGFFKLLRYLDRRDLSGIDLIFANSGNVKKRLINAYGSIGEKITVVFPPVNIQRFKYIKTGDFYLSVGRLSSDKNVDKIVQAFIGLPDKKLVVVGDGAQKKRIEELARGKKNIKILGNVTEDKLIKLYGECIAALSVSTLEDFGMIPIEAMAAGKPTIVTRQGGFIETVKEGETGLFIDKPYPDLIAKAVKDLTPSLARKMRRACEKSAELYSEQKYLKSFKEALA